MKLGRLIKTGLAALSALALMVPTNMTIVEAQEDTVEITFWYAFGDAVEANNQALTERFNETVGAENGVHVSAEFQGNYEDIYSKLQSAFVAGETPHVSVVNSLGIVQFAKNGMLQPIGDYIAQEDLDDFYPGLLMNSYFENIQYGLPFLRSTPIMFYNTSLFEEYGIDTNLETFDNVLAAARALKDNGIENGLSLLPDQWHFDALIRQSGGSILNEDLTEAVFASPEVEGLFQFLRDGLEEEVFTFYPTGTDQTTAYSNNQLGLWFQSTGSLVNTIKIADEVDFDLATAFIPTATGDRNVPTGGANIAMIAGHSEEENEAAALFMNFLTAPDQAAQSHINTGYLPTRQSLAEHADVVNLHTANPQYATALAQLDYAGIEPNAPGYAEVVTILSDMITELLTTDEEFMPTLELYQAEANAILEANR